MTSHERLEAAFALQPVDHTPILGGWIACPEHIARLTGVALDDYWADPVAVSIRAYERLGVDGLIGVFVPPSKTDYRCVDHVSYAKADRGISVEEAVERVDAMPEAEAIEDAFDLEAAYAPFRKGLLDMQLGCGDMMWMPAQWGAGAKLTWYSDFGYETYLMLVGLYPGHAQKLMEVGGAQGRCQSMVIARAVTEGLYPKAVLLGEDICTQRGPMISPDFLERYYAPALRHGLEPLLEAGCRPVWHCDGDVRPMLDFLIDAGVQGLQGFQPECGMVLDQLVERRTRDGEPLVIFGPLAVTTELPVLTADEVRACVRRAIDVCHDRASLVLFTANTINPDVPLENIIAMCEEARL